MWRFQNRTDAGEELARCLSHYRGRDVVVFGLPRGGVITAKTIADALDAPMDVIIARKIGHPENPEYAVGAVTDDGETVFDHAACARLSFEWLEKEAERQILEGARRRASYLGSRARPLVEGKTAIVVDDGVATGYTMEAAIQSVRHMKPSHIVIATPVAPKDFIDRFQKVVDEVVVVQTPRPYLSVGQWYVDFRPVDDREVIEALEERGGSEGLERESSAVSRGNG